MKSKLKGILAHPLTQVISFSIILVGSPYFGGPYLYFILGSFREGYMFGILGLLGIAVTLSSLAVKKNGYLQIAGLTLMITSLAIFFFSSTWENATITLLNAVALVTLLLFIVVSVFVSLKLILWKSY